MAATFSGFVSSCLLAADDQKLIKGRLILFDTIAMTLSFTPEKAVVLLA